MKALTVRQPWAGAIAHQSKRVENRSWKLPAKHEGARILTHAGSQPARPAQVYAAPLDASSPVVAVATLTGCHWSDEWQCCGYWAFENAYHWTLDDVLTLPEPIRGVRGQLGIWTPPTELVATVTSQLMEVVS